MTLSPGQRRDPHEPITALGAGGMVDARKAKGSRLDRHVAVKVLPVHPANTIEVLARSERIFHVLIAAGGGLVPRGGPQ